MAKRGMGLLSGRKKHSSTGNFVGLDNVEEYLGVPSTNNSIVITHTDGSRNFYTLHTGLTLDHTNDRLFVDETTVAIDTTGFNFSSATTLDQVLADLDANVNTAVGSTLTAVSTDSTISGLGTSASPLSIGQAVTTTSNVTFNDINISGDLTVSGTTTYIDTNTLNIGDNLITLNADILATTAPSEDSGIEVKRGTLSNVSLIWDESQDQWTVGSQKFEAGAYEVSGYGAVINSSGEWVGQPAGADNINSLSDGFSDGSSVALGANAMCVPANISANTNNTALGILAQRSLTTGECNIAIGNEALKQNLQSTSNVAIGFQALMAKSQGFGSVAVGNLSQRTKCCSSYNTSLGHGALECGDQVTDGDHVAIGYKAAVSTGNACRTVVIGSCAALNAAGNYTGSVYIGYTAGKCATFTDTVAIGNEALGESSASASCSVLIGARAGKNSTGSRNVVVGSDALTTLTTGNDNIAIGPDAFKTVSSNVCNGVAIGARALSNSLVSGFAIGIDALCANTTGSTNFAIGTRALRCNTEGELNLAIGEDSLCAGHDTKVNLAIGYAALRKLGDGGLTGNVCNHTSAGAYNTAIGSTSLPNLSCGDYNTVLGYNTAGSLQCGSGNIVIGFMANVVGSFGDQIDNQIVIGSTTQDRLIIPGVDLDTNDAADGEILQWSATNGGFVWTTQSTTLSVATTTTAPSPVTNGAVWFDTCDGTLSVYYNDGNTAQWVTTSGPQGCQGIQGIQGIEGPQGPIGYTGSAGLNFIDDLQDAKSDAACRSYGIGLGAAASQTTSSSYNLAIGYEAGCAINSNGSSFNTYLGAYAGQNHTSGTKNTLVGGFAAGLNGTINSVVAVGYNAGYGNTMFCDSVAVGDCAGEGFGACNKYSVNIGKRAGKSSCGGIAIGYEAASSHTEVGSGYSNVAIGYRALKYDTLGKRNIAIGAESLLNQTCGDDNIAIGANALKYDKVGLQNIAIGTYALQSTQNDACNTFLGNNIALGHGAGAGLGTVDLSACTGCQLMEGNIFIGAQSGEYTKCANENTFVGAQAGVGLYNGNGNIALGYKAFGNLGHNGDNNIVIGRCVCLGGFNATVSNKIAIGNNSADKLTIGSGGINFEADANSITIAGSTQVNNQTLTTTATTQVALAQFAVSDYLGGKFVIQATDNSTTERHISEVLMTHNGTTAVSTEYGIVQTNTSIYTIDVDISGGNVRVLVTPATTNSTGFVISGNMILA